MKKNITILCTILFLPNTTVMAQEANSRYVQGMSSWVFILLVIIFVVIFTVNNRLKKSPEYFKTFGTPNENGGFENFSKGKGIFKTDVNFHKAGGSGASGTW